MKFRELFEQVTIDKAKDAKGRPLVDLKDKEDVQNHIDALTDRLADNMSKNNRKDIEADIAALKKYVK